MDLDREQRKALALDHDIVVTAGAGAGKTRVLVERYLEALRREPDLGVRDVLAITFTDAAAAEMMTRVRDAVRALERAQPAGSPERERWEAIGRSLPHAWISTIHAFAARILREHGTARGVDPGFSVLDEAEARTLLATAVRAALSRLEGRRDASLAHLLARVPPGTLLPDLRRTAERFPTLPRWLREAPDDDRLLAAAHKAFQAGLHRFSRSTGQAVARDPAFRAACESLLSLGARGGDAATGLLRVAARVLRSDEEPLRPEEACEAASAFLTDSGAARSGFLKSIAAAAWAAPRDVVNDVFVRLSRCMRPLQAVKSAALARDPVGRSLLPAYVRVARLAREAYQDLKARRGVLDFDDLEHRAGAVLADGSFRGRFRHILVDEMQDTTPAQWAIVRRLHGRGSRLFVVGDPKQSIYAFRDADVSAFEATRRTVAALNRRALPTPAGGDEAPGLLPMPGSYRVSEAVARFVNAVFGRLFRPPLARGPGARDPLAGPEPPFEPLEPRRPDASVEGSVEMVEPELPVSYGSFVVGGAPSNGDPGGEAWRRAAAARATARRIRALVDGPTDLVARVRRGGESAPARYDDIACLVQSRTIVPALCAALRAAGIPHEVVAGRGTEERPEVADIANLLRVIRNARDDVALYGLLRGPWFAIPDEVLYVVSRFPGRSYYARLLRAGRAHRGSPLPPGEGKGVRDRRVRRLLRLLDAPLSADPSSPTRRAAIARAAEAIRRWRRLGRRLPPARLLAAALHETGALAAVAAGPDGEAGVLGVRRILDLAMECDDGGALLDRLQGPSRDREGTPPGGEASGGRVRILTVHGAKGLEFPIVILPQADRPLDRDRGVPEGSVCDRHLGIGLGLGQRDPDTGRTGTALRDLARGCDRRRRVAEEKRLFYVAATRARDHLILVGTGERPSWMRWAIEALGAPDGGEATLARRVLAADLPEPAGAALAPAAEAPEEPPPPLPATPRLVPAPFGTTATEIAAYAECPKKFFYRHVLSLDEGSGVLPSPGEARPRGRTYGIACHRTLELVARGLPPAEAASRAAREHGLGRRMERRLRDAADRFLGSRLGRLVKESDWVETERSYVLPVSSPGDGPPAAIVGAVDLALRTSEGLLVVDHKTGRMTDPASSERRYRVPIAIYRLMVAEAHGVSPADVDACLWYTEDGRAQRFPRLSADAAKRARDALGRAAASVARASAARGPHALPANIEACERCGFFASRVCHVARAVPRGAAARIVT